MKNIEQLRAVCEDIFQATGIRPVIYDADMRMLCAHPGGMSDFCAAVRACPGLAEKCFACDRAGFAQCRQSADICIYRCHMGLTEAAAPILDSGVVIGYLLFGQLLSRGERAAVERRIARTEEITDKAALLRRLDALEVIDEVKVRATAHLMTMCACYIRLHNLLRVQQESMAVHIADYIERRLADPALSIDEICKAFAFSRSTLYAVSKQAFAMGVTDYIRSRRVERAAALLRTSDLPLYRIAEQVGISDADYLTKLIRKSEGKSPREIRKAAR